MGGGGRGHCCLCVCFFYVRVGYKQTKIRDEVFLVCVRTCCLSWPLCVCSPLFPTAAQGWPKQLCAVIYFYMVGTDGGGRMGGLPWLCSR